MDENYKEELDFALRDKHTKTVARQKVKQQREDAFKLLEDQRSVLTHRRRLRYDILRWFWKQSFSQQYYKETYKLELQHGKLVSNANMLQSLITDIEHTISQIVPQKYLQHDETIQEIDTLLSKISDLKPLLSEYTQLLQDIEPLKDTALKLEVADIAFKIIYRPAWVLAMLLSSWKKDKLLNEFQRALDIRKTIQEKRKEILDQLPKSSDQDLFGDTPRAKIRSIINKVDLWFDIFGFSNIFSIFNIWTSLKTWSDIRKLDEEAERIWKTIPAIEKELITWRREHIVNEIVPRIQWDL